MFPQSHAFLHCIHWIMRCMAEWALYMWHHVNLTYPHHWRGEPHNRGWTWSLQMGCLFLVWFQGDWKKQLLEGVAVGGSPLFPASLSWMPAEMPAEKTPSLVPSVPQRHNRNQPLKLSIQSWQKCVSFCIIRYSFILLENWLGGALWKLTPM